MIRNKHRYSYYVLVASCLFFLSMPTVAEDDMEAMKSKIESLEKELSEIKTLLEKQVQNTATKEEVNAVKEEVKVAKKEAEAAKKEVEIAKSEQSEWKNHDSTVCNLGLEILEFRFK